MRYEGEFSFFGLMVALVGSALVGSCVPVKSDARSIIITALNYTFFVPCVVYLSFSSAQYYHIISFFMILTGVYWFSAIRIPSFIILPLRQEDLLKFICVLVLLAVGAQAAFGGLRHFSLDFSRVYEFRSVAAEEVPAVFSYIFSNVANVLVPIGLILSLRFQQYVLAALVAGCAVILFGMTHHKSVIVTPVAIVLLYLFFSQVRSRFVIGGAFVAVPLVAIAEVLYRQYFGPGGAGYFASLIGRRVLFTPVMLDSLYIDFFSRNSLYYWASSRFGSWISENPYGVLTAPYVIGEKYFSDPEMAANTGVIGSGFANAGLWGVAIYSIIVGSLLAVLNTYGRRIGHAPVAALSFSTIFLVVTTTDLPTALLTHGLLLLLLLLALFSTSAQAAKLRKEEFVAISTFK